MIYVVSHKALDSRIKLPESYKPLFVGPNSTELAKQFNGASDNDGDNISELNSNFCELTAAYWIWKNSNDEIEGLSHYRRYFVSNNTRAGSKDSKANPLNMSAAGKLLDCNDYILPEKYWLLQTVGKHYETHHGMGDLGLVRSVVKELSSEYIDDFDYCMSLRYMYPYNMMIARSKQFNEYFGWLFPILFEVYERMSFADRDSYQRRAVGFLSERLTAVYMLHNSKKVVECPVYTTERNLKRTISMSMAKVINRCI